MLRAALLALLAAGAARASTSEPPLFEAAFQGRCGEASPCEQLCRELHDGTFECGCGPGYELAVNGYQCQELNTTKPSEPSNVAEDILYSKDVSFSAELEIAPPSNNISPNTATTRHIDRHRVTTVIPDGPRRDYAYTGEREKEYDGLRSLMEDGVSEVDLNIISYGKDEQKVTTQGPSLEQKVPGGTNAPPWTAAVDRNVGCKDEHCSCENSHQCRDTTAPPISTPRFSGSSWLALRALRGAYKRVRLRIRVRPERARGVLLLTGEHDDLKGDYLAIVLRDGHVELRFDCGSGAGVLRSPEPVRLGHWNTISVYRHRWDAWLRLNTGRRARGRSKGLFSRMTFREPVWVGGGGNTSGLVRTLGLSEGLVGCVDYLRINSDTYRLVQDALATLDVGECAPTLAPWRPVNEVTSELPNEHSNDAAHIYNINDIVHFEDNDIVMRDVTKKLDKKLDNSVEQFKSKKTSLKDITKVQTHNESYELKVVNDYVKVNIKEFKHMQNDGEFKNNEFKQIAADGEMENEKLKLMQADGEWKSNEFKMMQADGEFKSNEAKLMQAGGEFKNNEFKHMQAYGEMGSDKLKFMQADGEFKSNDLKLMQAESSCACQHGGGCVNGVCLCPLGYAGDKCEITLDLKVPRFNGSSYLRLPGLGSSAQAWLDIQITLKPTSGEGLVLYNAESASGDGDFMSLHLRDYFVEFAFDLGSGIALVRSAYPLSPNNWHRISISRSGRRATLRVQSTSDRDVTDTTRSVTSHGTSKYLTLTQPMLLGGAPEPLPARLALKRSYSGCVGQLIINDEELSIVSSALGGVNVDNCDQIHNNSCSEGNCKEILEPTPQYPDNLSENDIHQNIVPKKGYKPKTHKLKYKKHGHIFLDKMKKKKYFSMKKHQFLTNEVTEAPYDGQTYIQIKYLKANEINWGDTNTYPSFTGTDSFIHIDDEETIKRLLSYTLDINIRFRSVAPNGLLVWSGKAPLSPPGDFLSLAIEDSVLVFRYDLGSGEVVIVANHTKVDDGLWHRARATRNRQAGVLEVDGLGSVGKISPGKLKQLNTNNGLYIGGLPSIEINTMGKYKSGLVGCVSQISLSGDFDIPLSLSKLPHTITNNVGRCSP